MARISGVDLPRNKRMHVALTYLHGIGRTTALKVCDSANVDHLKKVSELTEGEIVSLREVIDRQIRVEGDLRREVGANIKRLMDLGCYRGLRHRKSLPVNGQRTHTNARTRKGPRKQAIKISNPGAKK